MITKEQLETFDQNFKIIETTHDVNIHEALLTLNDVEDYKDNPMDFMLETDWVCTSSDVTSSDGYSIQDKKDNHVKDIYDLEDIANFIKNDMPDYLKGNN